MAYERVLNAFACQTALFNGTQNLLEEAHCIFIVRDEQILGLAIMI